MGQHNHKPKDVAAMVLSDLEDVAKVLADERLYCETCGAELPLWPPETLRSHSIDVHPETVWQHVADQWQAYRTDTDLARRTNFANNFRVSFVVSMLQHRRDLYEKLVEAGCIRAPAQG